MTRFTAILRTQSILYAIEVSEYGSDQKLTPTKD